MEDRREAVRRRLREDFEFYPEQALRIVDAQGREVPFRLKRPQRRMARQLMAQRDSGQPMRAVVLKARKVGFSTLTQGLIIQRATQLPHHHAQVVAQDNDTAGEIFGIGRFMWAHLPHDVRPELAYERNSVGAKYMQFGEPSLLARRAGDLGLNSRVSIATAKEVDAGRGLTIRSLHLSEVAFWPIAVTRVTRGSKKLGLLNAVPDDPDTLVVIESTANGHNHFKDDWDAAEAGSSGFLPIFTPWFEEPAYRRPFLDGTARSRFEASLGTGPWGEDEPELRARIPATYRAWIAEWGEEWDGPTDDEGIELAVLEHLNWRRWAIAAKCESDVEKFHQEYPSTPDEAFLSTGRKVFAADAVRRVLERSRRLDPAVPSREAPGPARGGLAAKGKRIVRAPRGVTIEVPTGTEWRPAARLEGPARWKVWQAPVRQHTDEKGQLVLPGQYIVACDPMSGEENEGELAHHAIVVVDHRTLEQVAEYESQDDPDQVALEVLLAAMHYNRALISVEITGGWGWPVVNRLARDYRYPKIYTRRAVETRMAKRSDRLGWSTDPKTKPDMEARAAELLRTDTDGIRSRVLAGQLLTYVRDPRGRSGPEPGKLSDVLMAWMQAQKVAQLTPLKPNRPGAGRTYGATPKTYGRSSA